jgi:ATP-dependent helicase/nuclease subunit B
VRRGSAAAAVVCRDVFATTERGSSPPPVPLAAVLPGLPEREQPGAAAVLATAARRNDARLDPELARAFIGGELRTSVSALESFAACPFQYFMRSMIAPQVAPGPAVTAADIGNLAHAVLKAIADDLHERGAGFGALVPGEIDGVVQEAMKRPLKRLEEAGLFKSRRERAMADLLRKQLVTLVAFLADAAVGLGAQTLHAEVRFGPRGALAGPRVSVPLAGGETIDAVLRGQIDRVDQWTAPGGSTWLAVLDYKLTERRMDWAAAADGMSLQLAGYLLVLGENAEAFGADAEHPPEIAGAFYVPVLSKDDKARKFRGVAPLSAFDALELGACGADGRELLSGDPKAAEKSPSRGDVLSDAQFTGMMDAARESIARHARSIAAGEIAVNPAVLRRTPPCGYCDFQAACRLDYSMNSRRSVPGLRQADAIDKWLGPPDA